MPNPYAHFRFRVTCNGTEVAGFTTVRGFTSPAPMRPRNAGHDVATPPRQSGLQGYEPLVLERGITDDLAFAQWASKAWHAAPSTDSRTSTAVTAANLDFLKDLTIELFNEAGQKVLAYTVNRCWAADWEAAQEAGGPGTAFAITRLRLEHQGWVRHDAMEPPTEATFT